MASRTVLHVGLMKTGTTHLQHRLHNNAAALLQQGVLLPARGRSGQSRAVRDAMCTARGVPSAFPGAWDRLLGDVAAYDGAVVISMEFLANAPLGVVRRLCETLPSPEAVITARDLNRSLPAMWQTSLRNGHSWGWDDYLQGARIHQPGRRPREDDPAAAPDHFWRRQHLVAVARRWSSVVPTTVVTVPPPAAPQDLLWERFCDAVGLEVPDAGWAPATGDNRSLGLPSCLALLRLNRELDRRGSSWHEGLWVRKGFLTNQVLPGRRAAEPRLGLPVLDWVQRRSETMRENLRRTDVRLVGEWDDLEPVEVPGATVADIDPEHVLDAATDAMAALVERDIARREEGADAHDGPRGPEDYEE